MAKVKRLPFQLSAMTFQPNTYLLALRPRDSHLITFVACEKPRVEDASRLDAIQS